MCSNIRVSPNSSTEQYIMDNWQQPAAPQNPHIQLWPLYNHVWGFVEVLVYRKGFRVPHM